MESLIFHELVDKLVENLPVAHFCWPFRIPPEDDADQSDRLAPERLEVSEWQELVVAAVVGDVENGVADHQGPHYLLDELAV